MAWRANQAPIRQNWSFLNVLPESANILKEINL